MFGTCSARPVDDLVTLVDEVYLPILTNPLNQKGWPDVIVREVGTQIQNFRNIIAEVLSLFAYLCFRMKHRVRVRRFDSAVAVPTLPPPILSAQKYSGPTTCWQRAHLFRPTDMFCHTFYMSNNINPYLTRMPGITRINLISFTYCRCLFHIDALCMFLHRYKVILLIKRFCRCRLSLRM